MSAPDGYLVVDKPPAMTSHDVVAKLRRVLGERRIGHAGTLDPDATGVLVLGVGRATRLLRYATELEKTYTCEIVLGVTTSTLDASGEVVGTFPMADVTPAAVEEAAATLTGALLQVPPMVSAVKVGGRRLHELARAGVEVVRAPRPVTVHEFTVEATSSPSVYRAVVRCSSGTYVRQLAADLGVALGGGAHLRELRRLAIGRFRVEEACTLEECGPERLGSPAGLVAHLETAVVGDAVATAVAHGAVLGNVALGVSGPGPFAVLSEHGALLAVYARRGDQVAPEVVLAPSPPPKRSTSPVRARGPVVTIGNFDGVHEGHRRLLDAARAVADDSGARLVVVTFDRHPAATLRPDAVPPVLTMPERKAELLRRSGADEVVTLAFDAARAAQSAEDFFEDLLVTTLNASAIVVGANFRFGHRAAGDVALLERLGTATGVLVRGVELAGSDGEPVSSTRVRNLIAEGQIVAANALLGRPHLVEGVATHEGTIVCADGAPLPAAGVYAVEITPSAGAPVRARAEVAGPGVLVPDGAVMSLGPCSVALLAEQDAAGEGAGGR